MVVDESDEGDALDPHPELSTGLWLATCCDFECMGADKNGGAFKVVKMSLGMVWVVCSVMPLVLMTWTTSQAV